MTFKGHGDHLPARAPQDIVLTLREKPHERFKRSGADLIVELSLDPAASGSTALIGVDGTTVSVPIPELVRHKSQVSVANAGLPERKQGALTGGRGALRVSFNLETRWATTAAAAEGMARERGEWQPRGSENSAGGGLDDLGKLCVVCMDGPREAVIAHGQTAHTVCCITCAHALKSRGQVRFVRIFGLFWSILVYFGEFPSLRRTDVPDVPGADRHGAAELRLSH